MLPVFTLGHSTCSLEDFLALLDEHGVGLLADVRRFPGSRRFPHFRRDALAAALAESGTDYLHRKQRPGSGRIPQFNRSSSTATSFAS